ncbi:polar amino acid transport system permease protein [Actinokineospora alba]|uniref:Polar amino acid transport system permease protein n=1 Tax=Actinokineospora alba TaxID=504798 RepID=A0A1H0HLP6_9PSEU|nr:ectoine/hydroxyectoine ABC transporter permease subunit EhuD [Actinokineospora alba]TDP64837.1 polar amino acid transport system permease protein [Actinokineospora alba]SDH47155.1 polar amino acid transport system permease protein [Actinokineospora alba]SDO20082.1 polar amino acid transport system permease protein [Actinokineospora alba]
MTWDWQFAANSVPLILQGLLVTLQITVLGSLVAYTLGLAFALVRRARVPVVDQVLHLFIEFVRSTPLLVQIFVLYYVFPSAFGISMSAFVTGVIAIGVHYACYTSEVYRAGIDAVPKGQWEAATALSLPRRRVWTSVILPQAVPRVLPALGNYTISMFKETPLLLAIGVVDLVNAAKAAGNESYRFVEVYTIAGLLFLLLSYPASLLVRRLERRVEPV